MDKERKKLYSLVKQWNESRLDLFCISDPSEKLEFHGVIRFYHQDSTNNGKYATKCVRVSSTACTVDVIITLAEKFRSDMRMLTKPKYGLYEVHVDGDTRKLKDDEKPLLVQLNWVHDDREGRFLLRNEDNKGPVQVGVGLYDESEDTIKGFKLTRNLTKREKKQQRKNKKLNNIQKKNTEDETNTNTTEISAVKHLYNQVPESTFTRTVSNPEAVMKKRREQKMQKRGADILKIYGDSLNPEIPYKSLLLLPSDKTDVVVRDALDKYGLEKESSSDYNIIKIVLPPGSKPEECFEGGWGREVALDSDECPLTVMKNWQPHQGTLVFQLRKQPQRMNASKLKSSIRKPSVQSTDRQSMSDSDAKSEEISRYSHPDSSERQKRENTKKQLVTPPKLLQLSKSHDSWIVHPISPNVTEVGCNQHNAKYGQFIQLHPAPELYPAHCVITNMDGVVTVTPHEGSGKVLVNAKLIEETTMLSHEDIVSLGRRTMLVFCDPGLEIAIPDIRRKMDRVSSLLYPEKQPPKNIQGSPHKTNPNKSSQQRNSRYAVPPTHENNEKRNIGMEQYKPTTSEYQQRGAPGRNKLYSQSETSGMPKQAPPSLPASISVIRGGEKQLLENIFSVGGNSLHFKLSPSYTSYLFIRSLLPNYNEVVSYLALITELLDHAIQLSSTSVTELAFWMANSSEILNFMRQDLDLFPVTSVAQDKFAKAVQLAFRHLVQCMQSTLFSLMPAFLSESTDDLPGGDTTGLKHQKHSNQLTMYDILHMLSSAMSLLRRCRVNAALTIQLFSQLFHSINMWLFNKLVSNDSSGKMLCCREWGIRIRTRLGMIETWAEKQGLELAADCHLARITQATHLLQAPKHSADDIAAISGTCFKLNSLQLQALLRNYQPQLSDGEKQISPELIDKVVSVAQHSADELTKSDGRDVVLNEDPDLQLPFLLPEDGYSCDVLQGVPSGLTEFINSYRYEVEDFQIISDTSGSWTVHFTHAMHPIEQNRQASIQPSHSSSDVKSPKPEVISVMLNKRSGGMGLSIVAARGSNEHKLGIYIRSVVKDGAADLDGRIQAGDQLLSVDNKSLVGLDQARAAALMMDTGNFITLRVAKQGAIYHGLATLITEPSPPMSHKIYANQGWNGASPTTPRTQPPQDVKFRKFPEKSSLYDTKKGSVVNQSTPDLNEGKIGSSHFEKNYPRTAMSMISLQDDRMNYNNQNGVKRYSPQNRVERHDNRPTSYIQSTLRSRNTAPVLVSTRRDGGEEGAERGVRVGGVGAPGGRAFQKHSSLDNPNYDNVPSIRDNSIHSPKHSEPEIRSYRETSQLRSYTTKVPTHFSEPSSPARKATPSNLTAAQILKSSIKSAKAQEKQGERGGKPRMSAQEALSPRVATYKAKTQKLAAEEPPLPPPPQPQELEMLVKEIKQDKSQASKTLGRPFNEKKETKRPPKSKASQLPDSSKSSTLPRHFKSSSSSPWARDDREKREQAIQEELNSLRDEEIEELTARGDSLNSFEKDRLKNLLQEKNFQMRVQEERSRLFSDDDLSGEDCIPDRPDRDRIIQLEDVQAQRDAANKEKMDESVMTQQPPIVTQQPVITHPPAVTPQQPLMTQQSPRMNDKTYTSAFSPTFSVQKNNQFRNKSRSGPRPISDGYLLSSSINHDITDEVDAPTTPRTLTNAPVNFVPSSSTPGVIGAQEIYNDPRSKREVTMRREQATRQRAPDPSKMTFKDRQRLFQADRSSPVNKPRSSRKLLEIEQKLLAEMTDDYSLK
uniref:afadin isoform X2 n=1 Tax=Ciona intestinalis TaxID=7719 RepID=UPI00089DBD78|nr:afadin isoform X2 [Ciona intestinalis]|eukprot:XP_018669894.1 afadin isoform X2 [Ciona intestinalis]